MQGAGQFTPRRERDDFSRQPSGGSSFLFPGSGATTRSPACGPLHATPGISDALRMPVRSSLGMSSQFTPKLSNPLFSPAAHGQDSRPPSAAAPPDERPPLESILDGAVGDGAAATASARPAAPPVESADGFWVTVFGYHTPAMVPQVLQELRPSSGTIAQHRAGVGAWLHVRYTEWHQQQEALAKNGRVRHRASAPTHHQPAARSRPCSVPAQVLHGCMLGVIAGIVPASSATSEMPDNPMIHLRLQHPRGANYTVGAAALRPRAAVSRHDGEVSKLWGKLMELSFGW